DGTALDTVFIDKGYIAVPHLDRDWHQHCVTGDFHEVSAYIERHGVEDDLRIDGFFQIGKFDLRSGLQLGELLESIELFGLQRSAVRSQAKTLNAVALEACCLVRHAHLLVES